MAYQADPHQERALEWVRAKWGEDRRCDICGVSDWAVSETMTAQAERFFPPGIYRFVPIGCRNCGNTRFLNMAIVEADE